MSTWLTYSPNSGTLHLPCISIQTANLPPFSIAAQVEAICIIIAQHQPGNPLGLFQHPETNVETQLRFIACQKKHQHKVVTLLEAMYEYCNNPMHLRFDIDDTEDLSVALEHFIKQHQLPFSNGGLIADERGKPSCLIAPQ